MFSAKKKSAIAIKEDFSSAYFNKAHCFSQQDLHEKALECFKETLQFDVEDALSYYYIGECYEKLEKYSMGTGDRFGHQGKAQLQAMIQAQAKGIELEEEKGSGPGCLGSAVAFFIGIIALMAGPGPFRILLIFLINKLIY